MRKWVLRAKRWRSELWSKPDHCKEVVHKKNTLFAEMMAEAGHDDANLSQERVRPHGRLERAEIFAP